MNEIPPADSTWIDAATVRFEQEWKAGTRPRIEDFRADVDKLRWPLLPEELPRVERELRRRSGADFHAHSAFRRSTRSV